MLPKSLVLTVALAALLAGVQSFAFVCPSSSFTPPSRLRPSSRREDCGRRRIQLAAARSRSDTDLPPPPLPSAAGIDVKLVKSRMMRPSREIMPHQAAAGYGSSAARTAALDEGYDDDPLAADDDFDDDDDDDDEHDDPSQTQYLDDGDDDFLSPPAQPQTSSFLRPSFSAAALPLDVGSRSAPPPPFPSSRAAAPPRTLNPSLLADLFLPRPPPEQATWERRANVRAKRNRPMSAMNEDYGAVFRLEGSVLKASFFEALGDSERPLGLRC